jgi:hypothetical protein
MGVRCLQIHLCNSVNNQNVLRQDGRLWRSGSISSDSIFECTENVFNDSIRVRTTDWMHIRQDRWIQKELAVTSAKNATTPNPFKIIHLESTMKQNSWETEETLARRAVTLETERAKWPNPWCLWGWWWKCFQPPPSLPTRYLSRNLIPISAKTNHLLPWRLFDNY